MARKNNSFRKGSGCYSCDVCGKRTRETGQGESQVGLCARCYDEAGWENEHQDGGHEPGSHPVECPFCRTAAMETPAVNDHLFPAEVIDEYFAEVEAGEAADLEARWIVLCG